MNNLTYRRRRKGNYPKKWARGTAGIGTTFTWKNDCDAREMSGERIWELPMGAGGVKWNDMSKIPGPYRVISTSFSYLSLRLIEQMYYIASNNVTTYCGAYAHTDYDKQWVFEECNEQV
jgi:hypothetical protein